MKFGVKKVNEKANVEQKTDENTSEKKDVMKSSNRLRKVIALFLSFTMMVLLLSEISTFVLYAVPMIGIQIFQMTGIGIESGLTFNEFTVSDFSVMFMMWIMPCIFFIGLSIWVHCKLVALACRKAWGWLRIVFVNPKKS